MGIWKNSDGLVLRFGVDEADEAIGYERSQMHDGEGVLEFVLNYTDLPGFADAASAIEDGYATGGRIINETIRVPEGIFIKSVEIITQTAWTSAASAMVLDIGLVKASDRTTEKDFNGFVAAITHTEINEATGVVPADSVNDPGWVGALVGTVLTSATTAGPWLLTADIGVATATAGKSVFRIHYFVPTNSTDTLGTVLS